MFEGTELEQVNKLRHLGAITSATGSMPEELLEGRTTGVTNIDCWKVHYEKWNSWFKTFENVTTKLQIV